MKELTLFLLFLAGMISCRKEDPAPECGCDGPVLEVVKDFDTVYKSGFFVGKQAGFLNVSCGEDLVTGKIVDGDSVIVSGNVRRNCTSLMDINTLIAIPSLLEVTAIRKK